MKINGIDTAANLSKAEEIKILETLRDNRRRITELERQLEEKNRMIQGLREDLEAAAKDRDIASRAAQEYRSLYNKADQKAQKVNELREALKAVLESED